MCVHACLLPHKRQDKISPVLANQFLVCLSVLLCFCRNTSLSFTLILIWGKLLYTKHTRANPRILIPILLPRSAVIYLVHTLSSRLFLPLLWVLLVSNSFSPLLVFSTSSATNRYLPVTLVFTLYLGLASCPTGPEVHIASGICYIPYCIIALLSCMHAASLARLEACEGCLCVLPFLGFPLRLTHEYPVLVRQSVGVC